MRHLRFPRRCAALTALPAAALTALLAAALSGVAAAHPARSAATAPAVQVMVVGSSGSIIAGPRTLAAGSTSVSVAGRSCAVAAATPLAALAALHAAGGPSFLLRDYGHCGHSQASSAQLFVYNIGGQANSGQSGWEYKVDGVSGSTGAADPSGPLGNGRRIGAGERVLWFYCHAHAGGCQRTLEVQAPAQARPGQRLSVLVTGADNDGHRQPVAGALVHLGSDFTTTSSSGQATVIMPSRQGSYELTATRSGLVPSFPATVSAR